MTDPKALVVVFLRGGADGLALVPPHSDDRLYSMRPTLASARPDQRSRPSSERAVDVDGQFGLHPSLAPLGERARAGGLAIVHAVGSDDATRSHFEAQTRMELAGTTADSSASGWLARHIITRPGAAPGPLAAIAFGSTVPESVRGMVSTAVQSIDDLAVHGPDDRAIAQLERLYGGCQGGLPLAGDLGRSGVRAIHCARRLAELKGPLARPVSGYPPGALGAHLSQAALLLEHREELGLEVITIDHGGWDTHFVQAEGLGANATELGLGLSAFLDDLGDETRHVAVVVMSEFGRRAHENVSLGTDHGRASCAFVAGGALLRRGVLGHWPGLGESELEEPGDLRVTTDYRSLLWEIVEDHLGNLRPGEVFPGLERPRRLGLFKAA